MPNEDDRYVAHHFWTIAELAEAVGESEERVSALIDARCAPGPVYVRCDGRWWSALDDTSPSRGEAWYAPGAAWGLRRALVATRRGAADEEAASMLACSFSNAFASALTSVDGAALAVPQCFDPSGHLDAFETRRAAASEWAAWLDGGYGVCLRIFTAANCVAKETLAALIKAALVRVDYDVDTLLVQTETLAGLILPFAPWQRSTGTPGRTIDQLLRSERLGSDRVARAR